MERGRFDAGWALLPAVSSEAQAQLGAQQPGPFPLPWVPGGSRKVWGAEAHALAPVDFLFVSPLQPLLAVRSLVPKKAVLGIQLPSPCANRSGETAASGPEMGARPP